MCTTFLNSIYEEYIRYYKECGEPPKKLYLNHEMYHVFLEQIAEAHRNNLLLGEMRAEPKMFWGMEIVKEFRKWRVE